MASFYWVWAFLHSNHKLPDDGIAFHNIVDQTITECASLWTPGAFTSFVRVITNPRLFWSLCFSSCLFHSDRLSRKASELKWTALRGTNSFILFYSRFLKA